MATPEVDLIYETTCPNADRARALLRDALGELGRGGSWNEWNRSGADFPSRFDAFGSPTILVNGADVAGDGAASHADSCRVYLDNGQLRGVPTLDQLTSALREAQSSSR